MNNKLLYQTYKSRIVKITDTIFIDFPLPNDEWIEFEIYYNDEGQYPENKLRHSDRASFFETLTVKHIDKMINRIKRKIQSLEKGIINLEKLKNEL